MPVFRDCACLDRPEMGFDEAGFRPLIDDHKKNEEITCTHPAVERAREGAGERPMKDKTLNGIWFYIALVAMLVPIVFIAYFGWQMIGVAQ